jgi:hypothetical protein
MIQEVAIMVSVIAGGITIGEGVRLLLLRIQALCKRVRARREKDRQAQAKLVEDLEETRRLLTELIDRTRSR